jgi:hypothetical protein
MIRKAVSGRLRVGAFPVEILVAVLLVFASSASLPADRDGLAVEVEGLLEFIRSSGCRFNRNGTWYEADEAAAHIDRKYRYALNKGLIGRAEDFIEYAASRSSVTGKEYLVWCKDAAPQKSAEWLTAALEQIRNAR